MGNGTGTECVQVVLLLLLVMFPGVAVNCWQVTERLSLSKMMGGGMSTPFFASKCKSVRPPCLSFLPYDTTAVSSYFICLDH